MEAFPERTFEEAKKIFREFHSGESDRLHAAEKAFRNLVTLLIKNQKFPEPKVSSRIKDWNECIKKFDGKYRGDLEAAGKTYVIQEHITDLIGLRVICIYESDIDLVVNLLKDQFDLINETNKTKQIENLESGFGYKGVHLDLKLNKGRKALPEYAGLGDLSFEVQVRTIVQDAWSEVDHKLKYKKQTPINIRRRILRLAALFELADQEFESIKNLSMQLEVSARDTSQKIDEKNSKLDLFGFIRVASDLFPGFGFAGDSLDGLLGDISSSTNELSISDFRSAIVKHYKKVEEYSTYMATLGHNMSPYTVIRHCLYLFNPSIFEGMIFSNHRKNFDRWLNHGTVIPSEISP